MRASRHVWWAATTMRSCVRVVAPQRYVSGSKDTTIKLWHGGTNLPPSSPSLTLNGHTDSISDLAFLTASHALASASHDGTIRVWRCGSNASSRQQACDESPSKNMNAGDNSSSTRITCSEEGNGGRDMTLEQDILTWESHHVLRGHQRAVQALVVIEGTLIASASDDSSIRLWDAHAGILLHTLCGHRAMVSSLCVSRSHRAPLLFSGDAFGIVRLWNLSLLALPLAHDTPCEASPSATEPSSASTYPSTTEASTTTAPSILAHSAADTIKNLSHVCQRHRTEVWVVTPLLDGRILSLTDHDCKQLQGHDGHTTMNTVTENVRGGSGSGTAGGGGRAGAGGDDLLQVTTSQPLVLEGQGAVRSACVLSDGRLLTGDLHGRLMVWE